MHGEYHSGINLDNPVGEDEDYLSANSLRHVML